MEAIRFYLPVVLFLSGVDSHDPAEHPQAGSRITFGRETSSASRGRNSTRAVDGGERGPSQH